MENNLYLSRFWTRIWALLIDTIILGVFGFIVGLIFRNFFLFSLGKYFKLKVFDVGTPQATERYPRKI
jgi:hypothetical protein